MLTREILLAVACFALPGCATSVPSQLRKGPTYAETTEFKVLLRTRVFEDRFINESADASSNVTALRLLLAHPQAKTALAALLDRAQVAGQLYALCGLFFADNDRFRASIRSWKGRVGSVERQVGCEIFATPIANLISSTFEPVAQLRGPEQSLADWVETARGSTPLNRFRYATDIAGGGIPARFCDRTGRPPPRMTPEDAAVRLALVGDRFEQERGMAWEALVAHGERALPSLTRLLRTGSPRVKAMAARACGAIGPAARPTLSALSACLAQPDPELQFAAAGALTDWSPWALLEASAAIYDGLANSITDPDTVSQVLCMLEGMAHGHAWVLDPRERKALGFVEKTRENPRDNRRYRLSKLPARSVRALSAGLRSDDDDLVYVCAKYLSIGGARALPELIKGLKSDRAYPRKMSAYALVRIATEDLSLRRRIRTALTPLRSDPAQDVRKAVVAGLAELGPAEGN